MHTKEIKWTIFLITVVGNFLGMFDSTTVNLALYAMSTDLGVSLSQIQWVVIAYMLILTVLLPFFGKLGDILPKNKLYATGFLLFALGSFLNFTANNFYLLVLYRCIEAIGASIMISNAPAIIASIFKSERRGKALGLNGCVVAIGGLSGPAMSGILINFFGWHSIFLPSIPIALAGAYFAYKLLPSHVPHKGNFKFDYLGFAYFSVGILALLLAISEGHIWGWTSLKIIFLGFITLVFGTLFYLRDNNINYPMINFKLFEIREFTFGNLAIMTSYMAMFTNSVLLPFYLQEILLYSPMKTGLVVLSYAVVLSITAPFAGRYAGKHGSKYITLCGAGIYILSLLMFITFNEDTSTLLIILVSGFMGIGNGLFQSPSNNAILSNVPKPELGVASGILALSRNVGNILGVAITITLFASFKSHFLASGKLLYNEAFLKSFHYTMSVGVLFAIACFTLAYLAYKNETYRQS